MRLFGFVTILALGFFMGCSQGTGANGDGGPAGGTNANNAASGGGEAGSGEGGGSAADTSGSYDLDTAHTAVYFKISHLGYSYTFGRFNDVSGSFTLDADDPSKSSFNFEIKTESIDTANEKRDEHLRGPDFFNAGQFPVITFNSTGVSKSDSTYEVTGDLNLHGVSKSITVTLTKLGEGKGMQQEYRAGFDTMFTIKRSDFEMTNMLPNVGDEVTLAVSFEGIKK